MKQYLSTFAGSAICGGFAFGIWPELWKTYGLMGGWLAATLIIGIMWYIKHCSLSIYIILTEPDRRNRPYNIANHTICRIVVFSRWAWKGFWWRDGVYRVLTELTLPIVS